MGLVYSNIILSNPVKPDLKPITVRCLVDSGSPYLVIPQHVATQLEDEVLLGAVAMGDMDLVIIPKFLKLSVNPESPNIPRGHVK